LPVASSVVCAFSIALPVASLVSRVSVAVFIAMLLKGKCVMIEFQALVKYFSSIREHFSAPASQVHNHVNPSPSSFPFYFARRMEGLGPRLDRLMDLMNGNPLGVLLTTVFKKNNCGHSVLLQT